METNANRRPCLKVVQESASDKDIIVGNDRSLIDTKQQKRRLSSNSGIRKRRRQGSSFAIYEDSLQSTPDSRKVENIAEKSTNTDEEFIAVESRCTEDDLISENPSIDYWKELAETRRKALENALIENEQLHTKVGELEERVSELEGEQSKYQELAERAEYLADTIKFLTEDDNENGSGESPCDGDDQHEEETVNKE